MAQTVSTDPGVRSRLLRRLAFFAIPLLLLVAAAVGYQALEHRVDLSAADHIERGLAERNANNLRGAIIEFANAVQKEPDNATARLLLGRYRLEAGNAASAERDIERARELGAPAADWVAPLTDALLAQEKFAEVLTAVVAPADAGPGTGAEVDAAHGAARLAMGETPRALEHFETALRADPENLRALLGIASVRLREGTLADARVFFDRARALAPESPQVMRMEGELAYAARDFEAAVAAYRRLRERLPGSTAALHALARAQIAAGATDEASTLLDQALSRNPQDAMARYLRALAAYRGREFEMALDDAEILLSNDPRHAASLLLSGGSLFALGRLPQAQERLERLVQEQPDFAEGRRLLAAVLVQLGENDRAKSVLEPLEDAAEDDARVLALLGSAARGSGDLAAAERYLARAATARPDSPQLLTELGTVRLRLGDTDQGIEDLEQVLQLGTGDADRALVALVRTHVAKGDTAKAFDAIERRRAADPDGVVADILDGLVHLRLRDLDAAKASFRAAHEKRPDARDAIANLASAEVLTGDLDAAVAVLREGIERTGGDARLILQLAAVESRRGEVDAAIDRLQRLVGEQPGHLRAWVLLAPLYLQQTRYGEADAAAAKALALAPEEPMVIAVAADVDLALARPEQAIERLTALTERVPPRPEIHVRLAEANRRLARFEEAERQLGAALALQPDFRPAAVGLARLQLEQQRSGDAAVTIGTLAAAHPDDPAVLSLQIDLAVAEGRHADTAELLSRLVEVAPSPQRVVRLAVARRGIGDARGADAALADWLRDHPEDPTVTLVRGDLAAADDRWTDAVAHYQRVVDLLPDNAAARNNLAFSLWKAGRTDDAVPHAERAIALEPANPNVLDTLGMIYVDQGQIDTGKAMIEQAVAMRPDNLTYRYHLAVSLGRAGDAAAAKDLLQRLLAEGTAFPERADAEALLDDLGR